MPQPRHIINIPKPTERMECLRQLKQQEQEQKLLARLADQSTPEELVIRILGFIIIRRQPDTYLKDEQTLASTVKQLLGGTIAAEPLYDRLAQSLLENSRARLDITFKRQKEGEAPQPILQYWHSALPHRIRHLELHCTVEVSMSKLRYPISLLQLTQGLPSLASNFPDLCSLKVVLDLAINENEVPMGAILPPAWQFVNSKCYFTYTKQTTFRALIAKLVDAVRQDAPGRERVFVIKFVEIGDKRVWSSKEFAVRFGEWIGKKAGLESARTAEEVVDEAIQDLELVRDREAEEKAERDAERQDALGTGWPPFSWKTI
ncbi:hypothetical protein LTR37_001450 [Vermiconidia calcicola]|uniref:Uncharacterized protein n=1 Tax=Vermiconidia calcicola TaxID=1690605 RepID=A0ACC3NVL1_9PEZI|nr:hypothetical protein LTR37_001450 [Vermiconidia calcicola]